VIYTVGNIVVYCDIGHCVFKMLWLKYEGKSESRVPLLYCHQITSHIEMPLYSLVTHFTSLFFHLLCWGTCLGGKSISPNPVNRRWDPNRATMFAPHAWHHNVIWIAWQEDVSFFHFGEEMKVRRCQIRAVRRVPRISQAYRSKRFTVLWDVC